MLRTGAFRAPKAGCTRAEYEDAIAWSRRGRRFAIADGASASAFARLWAHLLVQAYVAGHLRAESLEQDLATAQGRWAAIVDARPLPWYAQEQARRGAFAALAGLTLARDRTWSALAVGDCCVFHVRDGALLAACPIDRAEDFDTRPLLLGSRALANARLRECGAIVAATGQWLPGDTFLLMSDALAASFLDRASPNVLDALSFERTPRGFRRWLRELRHERLIRNDDVSLLWLATDRDAAA